MWLESRAGSEPGGGAVASGERRVDWLSAGLLGVGLGLVVLALYPDDPTRQAVNQHWRPLLLLAACVLGGFGWLQSRRLAPLVGPGLLRSRSFWAALAANVLAGAALMVALVEVPLLGRGVFALSTLQAGLLLTRFLVGVPLGAVLGGWLAQRWDRRAVIVAGLVLAGLAFAIMAFWRVDELRVAPAAALAELVVAGFGFGLIIAPLTATVLDLAGTAEHGIASSLVVLARTVGMVVGLAGLTAFGLARFQVIFARQGCRISGSADLQSQIAALETCARAALLLEYREIFTVASAICVLAAAVSLLTAPPAAARA